MLGKTLMIQGTASNVGKSAVVTAFCRYFARQGLRVAPFKSWNMALNSYVTVSGEEIGRAQGEQAEAAGIVANGHMNPFLIKPKGDGKSQIICRGKALFDAGAGELGEKHREFAMKVISESLSHLRREYDLVVIEGAGSPAEINVRHRDIANMEVALLAQSPVLLVGDMEHGGVFASLLGTMELLAPQEQERVAGFLINKCRGEKTALLPGIKVLEERTKRPVIGVLPYLLGLGLAEEDSVALSNRDGEDDREIVIGVVELPHISNFTDFSPLAEEPDVAVRYLGHPSQLEGVDCVILPGTKNTVADLQFLREKGFASVIKEKAGRGFPVVGICGGYQMLGEKLFDPYGYEGPGGEMEGLGLLKTVTEFAAEKAVYRARGILQPLPGWLSVMEGEEVDGYEIHMGRTASIGAVPLLLVKERGGERTRIFDGAVNETGNVFGTYFHGIFDNDNFRHSFCDFLRQRKNLPALTGGRKKTGLSARIKVYDRLADALKEHVEMGRIREIIGI